MSATLWRLAAIAMMLAAAPAFARQTTEAVPPPVVIEEEPAPAPGTMGPPPSMASPPVPDDDKHSWCRGPEGNITRCKSAGQIVIDDGSFPERAEEDEVEGSAVIWCTVKDPAGHIACRTMAELPTGYGFGEAAVKAVSRSSLIVSPFGYDLTGYGHSVSVPFVFSGPLNYTWRDFASADGLAALMTADDRAKLPPLGPDGFEIPNADVTLMCEQSDENHHVLCDVDHENVPALKLGEGVVQLMNAEARLVVYDGLFVRTTVTYPLVQPHLVTPIPNSDAIFAAAAAKPPGLFTKKPKNGVTISLRCLVKDAEGHLGCEVAYDTYPDFHFGEEIRKLYEDKGRVTIEPGWALQGRTVRFDVFLLMTRVEDCREWRRMGHDDGCLGMD